MFTKRNLMIINGVLLIVLAFASLGAVLSFVSEPEITPIVAKVVAAEISQQVTERQPLAEYNVIFEKTMFDAKLTPPKVEKAPPPPPDLNWKLIGTSRFGSTWIAHIEMRTTTTAPKSSSSRRRGRKQTKTTTTKETKSLKVGDRVLEHDVTITEIGNGYVLYTRIWNGKEIEGELVLDVKGKGLFSDEGKNYDAIVKALPVKRNEYNVSKKELAAEITSVDDVLNGLTVTSLGAPDASGKTGGLEIQKVTNSELFSAFGLAEQDVIISINKVKIETQEDLKKSLEGFAEAGAVDLIIRRGKSQMKLKYNITN